MKRWHALTAVVAGLAILGFVGGSYLMSNKAEISIGRVAAQYPDFMQLVQYKRGILSSTARIALLGKPMDFAVTHVPINFSAMLHNVRAWRSGQHYPVFGAYALYVKQVTTTPVVQKYTGQFYIDYHKELFGVLRIDSSTADLQSYANRLITIKAPTISVMNELSIKQDHATLKVYNVPFDVEAGFLVGSAQINNLQFMADANILPAANDAAKTRLITNAITIRANDYAIKFGSASIDLKNPALMLGIDFYTPLRDMLRLGSTEFMPDKFLLNIMTQANFASANNALQTLDALNIGVTVDAIDMQNKTKNNNSFHIENAKFSVQAANLQQHDYSKTHVLLKFNNALLRQNDATVFSNKAFSLDDTKYLDVDSIMKLVQQHPALAAQSSHDPLHASTFTTRIVDKVMELSRDPALVKELLMATKKIDHVFTIDDLMLNINHDPNQVALQLPHAEFTVKLDNTSNDNKTPKIMSVAAAIKDFTATGHSNNAEKPFTLQIAPINVEYDGKLDVAALQQAGNVVWSRMYEQKYSIDLPLINVETPQQKFNLEKFAARQQRVTKTQSGDIQSSCTVHKLDFQKQGIVAIVDNLTINHNGNADYQAATDNKTHKVTVDNLAVANQVTQFSLSINKLNTEINNKIVHNPVTTETLDTNMQANNIILNGHTMNNVKYTLQGQHGELPDGAMTLTSNPEVNVMVNNFMAMMLSIGFAGTEQLMYDGVNGQVQAHDQFTVPAIVQARNVNEYAELMRLMVKNASGSFTIVAPKDEMTWFASLWRQDIQQFLTSLVQLAIPMKDNANLYNVSGTAKSGAWIINGKDVSALVAKASS